MPGVILYGPPAAGKDAVTEALVELDENYCFYQRLKVGAGRTSGYRMTTLEHIDALRRAGDVIWENRRYDALYVVDRASLVELLNVCVPVLHLGQIQAVQAVTEAMPGTQWVIVGLWCPRDVAARRLAERGTGDTVTRLRAWDETPLLPSAHLTINTAGIDPAGVAGTVHRCVQRTSPSI